MIPRTYPSSLISGERMIRVYEVAPSGQEYTDYIPITVVSVPTAKRNTYDTDGGIVAEVLSSIVGLQAWVDYIPVYQKAGSVPWTTNANGYIPMIEGFGTFGGGSYTPSLNFSDARNSQYLLVSIGGL